MKIRLKGSDFRAAAVMSEFWWCSELCPHHTTLTVEIKRTDIIRNQTKQSKWIQKLFLMRFSRQVNGGGNGRTQIISMLVASCAYLFLNSS